MEFENKIWNKDKIKELSPMQLGRLKKCLDTLYNFDGDVLTLKEKMESEEILYKKTTNNMWKWRRRTSNRLDGDEQLAYEKKLLEGRTYSYGTEDYSRDIAKIIYDVLNIREKILIDE